MANTLATTKKNLKNMSTDRLNTIVTTETIIILCLDLNVYNIFLASGVTTDTYMYIKKLKTSSTNDYFITGTTIKKNEQTPRTHRTVLDENST